MNLGIFRLVVLFIGSNIAGAFSLAGTLSIIRFRSAPGDPKDIGFIFFDIAAGLACGVGLYGYGAIFVVILCAVIFAVERFRLFDKKEAEKTLKITIPEDLNYEGAFDEMLDEIENLVEREMQFTSDASHELRTPVAVIMSECDYMTKYAASVDEFKESAESVKNQTERMSKLISELLSISRMDRNTQKLTFEETNLTELVELICNEQRQINESDITMETDIAPDISAEADRFMLSRLFINLISNAYKYNTENGRIRVTLSEAQDKIIFSVADTGIGIAKENIPKIWERFYRADESRTSDDSGSMGLGLSMVKWIAEKHGGEVSVKSELGVGSEFKFTFPKHRD